VSMKPGNFGGETLRQYCGLSKHRRSYYMGKLEVWRTEKPITAQDLYRAIRRHTQWRATAKGEQA